MVEDDSFDIEEIMSLVDAAERPVLTRIMVNRGNPVEFLGDTGDERNRQDKVSLLKGERI